MLQNSDIYIGHTDFVGRKNDNKAYNNIAIANIKNKLSSSLVSVKTHIFLF